MENMKADLEKKLKNYEIELEKMKKENIELRIFLEGKGKKFELSI
jgi:hypothetical protein